MSNIKGINPKFRKYKITGIDKESFFWNYQPISNHVNMSYLQASQKVGTKEFPDSVFFGEVVNGVREGIGLMTYDTGRIYEGCWKNDRRDGKGYELFENGNSFEGSYFEGKPEGLGKYIWNSGESYIGEWIQGRKEGKGTWKGKDNEYYIGSWKNNKPEGYGIYQWNLGNKYEGEWMNGLKHGKGSDILRNGDKYVGDFQFGKPHGFGKINWNNGEIYIGHFIDGLKEGFGIWKKSLNPPTCCFAGQYYKDLKNGFGIYKWSSGNYYVGQFVNNEREGIGEMIWKEGYKYIGQWSKGIEHGYGKIIINDQTEKIGVFESNSFMKEINPSEINELYLFEDFNIYSIAPDDFESLNLENDNEFNFIYSTNFMFWKIRKRNNLFPKALNKVIMQNNKTIFDNYEDFPLINKEKQNKSFKKNLINSFSSIQSTPSASYKLRQAKIPNDRSNNKYQSLRTMTTLKNYN